MEQGELREAVPALTSLSLTDGCGGRARRQSLADTITIPQVAPQRELELLALEVAHEPKALTRNTITARRMLIRRRSNSSHSLDTVTA
jgi:hypothetical protein